MSKFLSQIPDFSTTPLPDAEWERILKAGVAGRHWADLWRLARIAPLAWSAPLCRALGASGWTPDGNRETFVRLTALAAELPDPADVPFVRQLPRGVPDNITTELQVSPDGTLLAVNGNGPILIFRVPEGELVRRIQEPSRYGSKFIHNCAVSPDGRTLATQCSDEFPRLWDLTDPEQPPRVLKEGNFDASFGALHFTPDDAHLVVLPGGGDTVDLWTVATGALKLLKGHTMWVKYARITADGARLYTGSADKTVRVWALPEGDLLHTWQQEDHVDCMALSPDETRLAIGEDRKTCAVKVRDTATGEEKLFGSHGNRVKSVAFSPDGTLLASGGGRTVGVWRVADGKLLHDLRGHENFVECVAFSPDGRFIFSGGYDNLIHVWRAADGALVQVWRGSSSYTDPIVPLPDGRWVASCGWKEEHVWLWRLLPHPDAITPLEHLGDAYWAWVAESVARPDLSDSERAWLEFAHALGAVRLPLTALHTDLDAVAAKLTLPPGDSLLPHLNADAVFAALHAGDWEILAQQAEKLGAALPLRQRAATAEALEKLAERSYAPGHEAAAESIRQLVRPILRAWAGHKQDYASAVRHALGRLFIAHGTDLTGPVESRLFAYPQEEQDQILYHFLNQDWTRLEIQKDHDLIAFAVKRALSQGGDLARRVQRIARQADRAIVSVAMTRATGDAARYLPHDPAQRALHYFLLARWEDYEALDVDGSLLGAAYLAAPTLLKRVIAAHARRHGRVEFVRAVSHIPEAKRGLDGDDFWVALAETLAQGQHWRQLWELTHSLPLRAGILLLQRLRGRDWQPPVGDAERFAALLEAAARCPAELPAAPPREFHAGFDSAFALSPDGEWLAYNLSGGIELHHLPTGEERRMYDFDNREAIKALTFSPDGRYVAGASKKALSLWPVDEKKPCFKSSLWNMVRPAFTADGRYVLGCPPHYASGPVLLWRVPDGACVEIAPRELDIVRVCLRPQGDWVAAARKMRAGAIRRWRLPDGEPLAPFGDLADEDSIHALALSPDGAWLVSGHQSNALRVWEADTGRLLTTLHAHDRPPLRLAFSPDGKVLASTDHFTMYFWRVPAFEKVATPVALSSQLSYTQPVGLVFSPHSRITALIRKDNQYIVLCHTGRGTDLGRINAGENRFRVTDMAFTPDGTQLVCTTGGHYVQLWDLRSALLWKTRPDELNAADIAWLERLMARAPEPWGEAMLALLRWQRQYDIELDESRARLFGEFDIEMDLKDQ